MNVYFYLLEQALYTAMARSLTRSVRERSFVCCHDLCRQLLARNPAIPRDALVHAIAEGLPFDRAFWHGLVGECLVHGATDIPRLLTAPDSLCCLLAPAHYAKPAMARRYYAPIQQAHFGTRDLRFGRGYYRPDHAGLNEKQDVARLAAYLEVTDPGTWRPQDLAILADCHDDDERAEELAYVRDWWPGLVELYQNARAYELVVVCEMW